MHKITIKNEVLLANEGELLSSVLMKAGKAIEHPCGGKGLCGKCMVLINGRRELSCKYRVMGDITVDTLDAGEIVSQTGADETGRQTDNVCFALDIGTTTLALALVSFDENKIIKVITATNPQRAFGSDVMSRIDYCRKNSVGEISEVLIAQINKMIAQFGLPKVDKMYVAGNATMLHLFFGVDCSAMGVAPYTPTFLESKSEKASNMGICGVGEVISLPSIAAFVGADLVAGLNYIGLPKEGRYNLLIDLGTNAEIILFKKGNALCTAAAAGPCFEGANISCGMSATAGAVYSFSLDDGGKAQVKTVADAPAKGICGTGLVDIIAELVANGTIEETGYMEDDYPIADGVMLTGDDVRQYQLAKSAVYSAIVTLIDMENISFEDIENMYISGGFSAKINIDNAVKTGLLPKELKCKCTAINNSSLLGTVKFACYKNDLSIYLSGAQYVDLSSNPTFTNAFVENMMFE